MLDTLRRWAAMWRSVVGTMAQTEATVQAHQNTACSCPQHVDSRYIRTMCYTNQTLQNPPCLATVLSSHLRMMDRRLSFSRPQCSGHTATCMHYTSVVHDTTLAAKCFKKSHMLIVSFKSLQCGNGNWKGAHPRRSHISGLIKSHHLDLDPFKNHRPCTKLPSLVALMRLVSMAPPNLTPKSEMERLGCKVIQFLLQGMTDEEIGKVRANGKPSAMAERLFCILWVGDESSIVATNSQHFTLY